MLCPEGFVLGPRGVLVTNMLVSATRNADAGGHTEREAQMRMGWRSGGI